MVLTINSLTGDRFTDLAQAYLRLVDQVTGHEVARFDLADTQPSTAVIMAIIKRQPATGGWEMRAIGESHDTRFVKKRRRRLRAPGENALARSEWVGAAGE